MLEHKIYFYRLSRKLSSLNQCKAESLAVRNSNSLAGKRELYRHLDGKLWVGPTMSQAVSSVLASYDAQIQNQVLQGNPASRCSGR